MNQFSQEVWDTLSNIDVAPHVESISIGQSKSLSYVPWHKAWLLLKRHYPASTYRHGEDVVFADGTMEVEVHVTITKGGGDPEESVFTCARLAVMDNRFNAISNPNARDINDNRQRALVKALAFAGLGLSLWDAGSTVPVGQWSKPITDLQLQQLKKLLADHDEVKFMKWAGIDKLDDLSQEKYSQAYKMLKGEKS